MKRNIFCWKSVHDKFGAFYKGVCCNVDLLMKMTKWVIMGAKKLHKNGCLGKKMTKLPGVDLEPTESLVLQTVLNILNSSSVILSKVWACFIKDRFRVNYCTIYIGQIVFFCFYEGWNFDTLGGWKYVAESHWTYFLFYEILITVDFCFVFCFVFVFCFNIYILTYFEVV